MRLFRYITYARRPKLRTLDAEPGREYILSHPDLNVDKMIQKHC